MATTNRDRVGKTLEQVADGLGPWMIAQLEAKYGDTWPRDVIQAAGAAPKGSKQSTDDPAYLFWIFDKQWHLLFRAKVDFAEKRAVSALWDARTSWAHNNKFNDDQAERVMGEADLLLRAIGAVEQADAVDEMRRDLRRIRYEKDRKREANQVRKNLDVRVDSTGAPAWRDVIEPHDDVARGEFELAQFAADLRLVAQGKAGPEYGDPSQFFERTYLTRGLKYLLTQTAKRLNGRGGEPVQDLMTTFGGGKTHSQIAVYHAGSGTPVEQMAGMTEVLEAAGVKGLPAKVSRAVIVGNDLSVQGSVKADGTKVNTMWGEIAWQLGGADGYAMVAAFDAEGDPAPTTALEDLISAYAPAIILIDEWVAYLRQLYSRPETAPGGTFDGHMTFVQSLTEAVKAVPTAMLVASLPASDNVRDMGSGIVDNTYEIGGTPGLEALRHLASVIHRVESPWQPADIEESFEIVRRRLFKPLPTDKVGARDLTVQMFVSHYDKHRQQLPTELQQPGYHRTMQAAYPVHPELFKRLYEDWSTLERFQQTRGVLRLMATVVHALWHSGDRSPLITPATLPLEDQKVIDELIQHLDNRWPPIVDADIAGDQSTAATIDKDIPLLGRTMATRRVARCVFMGSAPAANALQHGNGPVRGIELKRVILGATYPGDNPAHLSDALRQLGDRGAFMNRDGDRYWLSLQQTVQRLVQERADGLEDAVVTDELTRLLRVESDRGIFERVHRVPADSLAVEDEPTIGLVIFGTNLAHSRKAASDAEATARRFLDMRGGSARIHKNTLVFLAPDRDRVDNLHKAVRDKLAWQYVVDNISVLNLDQHNITLARSRLAQATQTVTDRIKDTYRWLLVARQEPGAATIDIEAILMNGQGTLAERATRKCEADEIVVRAYTPTLLRRDIDRLGLWDPTPHVPVDRLAALYTTYLYMPKITNHAVIRGAVGNLETVLLTDIDGIAYAETIDDEGRYGGLVLGARPVTVSTHGLVVDPRVAAAQIAAEQKKAEEASQTTSGTATQPPGGGTVTVPPTSGGTTSKPGEKVAPPPPTRFHASKPLDPVRVVRDMSTLNEEIIVHFTAAGVPIRVTIDIDSDALDRLPPDKRTVVTENLKSLGFTDWGIE